MDRRLDLLDARLFDFCRVVFSVWIVGLEATSSKLCALLLCLLDLELEFAGLFLEDLCLCAAAAGARLNIDTSGFRSLLLLEARHAPRSGSSTMLLF